MVDLVCKLRKIPTEFGSRRAFAKIKEQMCQITERYVSSVSSTMTDNRPHRNTALINKGETDADPEMRVRRGKRLIYFTRLKLDYSWVDALPPPFII